MKKYRVQLSFLGINPDIDILDVERETANSVWIKGRRNAKQSEYARYYDSWGEAHEALLQHGQRIVESLLDRLRREEGALGTVKGLKE